MSTLTSTAKQGLVVHGFAIAALHRFFALQPELGIVTKGAGANIDGEERGDFSYTYLSAALLGRSAMNVHRSIALYGVLGFSLGYLLSASFSGEDRKETSTAIDVSIVIGIGTSVALSTGSLELEARYEHGLRSVDHYDPQDRLDIKNRALLLLAGYRY